jgi:hypothetical protein
VAEGAAMSETKYGKVYTSEKDIPEEEPLFLMRGQDVLAPIAIRFYADLVEAVCPDGEAVAEGIRNQADRMAGWGYRKLPD